MPRIRVMSDLHLEFFDFSPGSAPADVVVLAGDIHSEDRGMAWARRAFPDVQIVYVMGNHEYHGFDVEDVIDRTRAAARTWDVQLLECDQAVINGVRFLGTTMWTDFMIDGAGRGLLGSPLWYARRFMADFSVIRYQKRRLTPEASQELHRRSRGWLEKRIAEPFDGDTVVVTHHLPHKSSIHERFVGNRLNPAFASDLSGLVRPPVKLWIHGHTHCSCDFIVEGQTRVLCNPRGYGPHDLNRDFDESLVVEI